MTTRSFGSRAKDEKDSVESPAAATASSATFAWPLESTKLAIHSACWTSMFGPAAERVPRNYVRKTRKLTPPCDGRVSRQNKTGGFRWWSALRRVQEQSL